MDHNAIPLIRAAFIKPIIEVMLKNGISPAPYFERVGLPLHALDDPECLVPVKPIHHLVSLVATEEGIPDFGAQLAQIRPWYQIESLGPLINHCANLDELLKILCNLAPTQRTGVTYVVEEDEGKLWFRYNCTPLITNNTHIELYRVINMVLVIQLAAGPDWHPEKIQLFMPKTKVVKGYHLIRKSQITFSQEKSRILISPALLKLPINLEASDVIQGSNHYDINAGFIDTFRQIIAIYVNNKNLTLKDIAKATGIPIRTLQRRLKQHKLSFTDVVNETKFNLAKDKLENTSLTIMEIALQLGYSFPENFTLAFYRWAGMPPSKFREQYSKNKDFS